MRSNDPLSKVAIIGAGGQLGSHLCRQLGMRAIPLDLPDFDLTDRQLVLDILATHRPASAINAAGFTQVDRAEQQEALCEAVNATAVSHLAEACSRLGCPLVQLSTDYVFGGDVHRSSPYTEEDAPGPLNIYGRTKLAGERAAAAIPQHVIIRTCGLYGLPGPQTITASFVDKILSLASSRPELRVVSDQRCSPTYVPHLARAILHLVGTLKFGTYHVVNSGGPTWHDFASEIVRQAGFSCGIRPISSAEFGAEAVRPKYSVLDTAKYHTLGGLPMPSWQQALREYLTARLAPALMEAEQFP